MGCLILFESMKIIKVCLILVLVAVLFGLTTSPSYAGSFSDNFDDGNADGWWLGYSLALPWIDGNWSVIDGALVQDSGYDGVIGLVENEQLSSQIVETDTKILGFSGGTGIIFWFNDNFNMMYIILSGGQIEIAEYNNDFFNNEYFDIDYGVNEDRWVNLRVDANSDSGEIKVYMDGEYKFNYFVTTTNRAGQTGVINGASAAFDNFSITSESIVSPPTNKAQCKKGGWKAFTGPAFESRRACMKYIKINKTS